LFEFAVTD